ncbi:hypothetical protein HYH02_008424 [Chlamydomonas schloesseri]|uniref:Ubiquitin-like domain-containing protein n=1 Tax=Chlamydomonas schloesseri TaxID=2026947 RepID=A0A835WFE4_9CHLO|nr:hypothetical protein HYH02_008424 [Chlamydomonas schloesseri]|eukprot:KAG2446432.1 hypothetical protein HYH02_008424 [Chlamydomonas schloesseri]
MTPEDTQAAAPGEPKPAEVVEVSKSVAPAEPQSAPAAATGEASTSAATSAEQVSFKVAYGKAVQDCKRPFESTVGDLKTEIEKTTGIPSKLQKLMCKGAALKDDEATLRAAGIKDGVKLLLIGSAPAAVDAAKAAAAAGSTGGDWDAPKTEEPICKQTAHAKVLAKGVPDGALPGIAGRQVTMDDKITSIPGLLNSQGSKVRMTFKEELQQIWIGSDTSTQKVPYGSITKIESWPVEGNEAYSILALHLGVGGTSRYWLYFYPSQYVAGLKIKILGVQSLI